jgi:CheY-like chemotaxis protein
VNRAGPDRGHGGLRSISEARSGEQALAAVERLGPDLVLVDVRMPGMDGIETARVLSPRARWWC